MKEKLKKFWEWLKDFLSFSIDFIFIVAALFFVPFSLNHLFEAYPAIKTMFGDSNTGEILTYLSTTFLAFMALYQNNRFRKLNRKHEQEQKTKDAEVQKLLADKDAEMQEKMAAQNKEAQDRMAELVRKANEIALKSKIIDIESRRISEIENAVSNFDKACYPSEFFYSNLLSMSENEKDFKLLTLKNKSFDEFLNITRTFSMYLPECLEKLSETIKSYYKSYNEVINLLLNNEIKDKIDDRTPKDIEDMEKFNVLYRTLKANREKFILGCETYIANAETEYWNLIHNFK